MVTIKFNSPLGLAKIIKNDINIEAVILLV